MKYEVFNSKAFDAMKQYQEQHHLSLTEMERQSYISRMSIRHWLDHEPDIVRDTSNAKIIAFNQAHGLYTGKDDK